jgi:hypothetical protein
MLARQAYHGRGEAIARRLAGRSDNSGGADFRGEDARWRWPPAIGVAYSRRHPRRAAVMLMPRRAAIDGWNAFSGRFEVMFAFARAGSPKQAGVEECVVAGAADMTSSERVHELFNRCRGLLRQNAQRVVIDLQHVTLADTKLVACLVVLRRMAASAPGRLEICCSSAVIEIARVCRLEWLTQERGPRRDAHHTAP